MADAIALHGSTLRRLELPRKRLGRCPVFVNASYSAGNGDGDAPEREEGRVFTSLSAGTSGRTGASGGHWSFFRTGAAAAALAAVLWQAGTPRARAATPQQSSQYTAVISTDSKEIKGASTGSRGPHPLKSPVRQKMNSFIRTAAERVGPAVVRLDVERGLPSPRTATPLLRGMFGDAGPPAEKRERGQGSGFVYDGENGFIVTNAHVVKGSSWVKVTFTDGRVLEGSVLGVDDVTDIAIVKVDPEGKGSEPLPAAPLGNSTAMEIGDWVIAVGNPFGLDNTVTLGILSNLQRTSAEVGIPDKRLDFLQTDCAINPGNSGGPLVNEFGEVIGISTAIRADAEGIGFAIPINTAKLICARLSEGSAVRHPYIGIQMVTHTATGGTGSATGAACGVCIVRVLPASPAEAAGLQPGDVVTKVQGVDVRTARQLQAIVEQSTVGQTFSLEVLRGDTAYVFEALTGDMTGRPPLSKENGGGDGGAYKQLAAAAGERWEQRRGGDNGAAAKQAAAATATEEDERVLRDFWGSSDRVGRGQHDPLAVVHIV